MLSKNQFAVLRVLRLHRISIAHLGKYKDTTLFSLLQRGYFRVVGGYLELSSSGEEALAEYTRSQIPLRKTQAELTDRTSRYLRVARLRRTA